MELGKPVFAQALQLPDFSGLPGYAQTILYTVLAIGIAISVLMPLFGFKHGQQKQAAAANGQTANPLVVAAVVDPAALNTLSTQLSLINVETPKLVAVLARLADGIEDVHHELRRSNDNRTIDRHG